MLCIRGTIAMGLCLSVSVSQVGVLLKRLNRGSQKQHHTIAQGRGRQMQVGWVKIGDFRQITGYISKTVKYRHIVKDRHIVSIKVE